MQNKQEILEDAYEALSNSIKRCNDISKRDGSTENGDVSNLIADTTKSFSETAYYLVQVIKELEK